MSVSRYYDDTNPKSIEEFSQKLIGHTFREVESWNLYDSDNTTGSYNDKKRKGGLGNLIEEDFFGYKANSDQEADFPKAGVELKVTPYHYTNKKDLRAGERLVLTMISYEEPVIKDFYKSHCWEKCKLILIIYYHRDKELADNLDYPISYVKLFTPPENDLEIIKQDYQIIIDKIAAGKADELSEADTMYLGACTKGSTAEKSTVPQKYYAPERKAMRRAFCFKNSYMTYVLNNYIAGNYEEEESILGSSRLKGKTFADIIEKRISKYVGKTDKELCNIFGITYDNNKAQWTTLSFRMLGIKSNRAAEFSKANIVVKTIRLEENGSLRESSPLPNISFMDLIKEDVWEESELYKYLTNTKFFFVIFQKQGDVCVLRGSQLWNISEDDLNGEVKRCWTETKAVVSEGVKWNISMTNEKVTVSNNLPIKGENRVMHVRPHANLAYYVDKDGRTYGNGSLADTDLLPDGRRMTKQSFWLNNTYIVDQIK